jgi:hypothetical protein
MATRSIFSRNNPNEQNLIESLVIEAIQIYGIDMYYLPKTTENLSDFYGEDLGTTRYNSAYPIEMYVKNVEGFEGEGDFIQQFGIEIRDQVTFTVAVSRFNELGTGLNRPKEGDQIWFPTTGTMYTIQFVEDESIFYQLGKLYVFDLQCELFSFQGETFRTGVPEIDEFGRKIAIGTEIPLTTGSGIFAEGEFVSSPTMSGIVKTFDLDEPELSIYDYTSLPSSGETLIGGSTGAEWITGGFDPDSIEIRSLEDGDNFEIEQIADEFIDFTEENPFGRV